MALFPRATVPASIDLRNYNGKSYVQEIKDQEQCGSHLHLFHIILLKYYAYVSGDRETVNIIFKYLIFYLNYY